MHRWKSLETQPEILANIWIYKKFGALRSVVRPWDKDRYMSPDILASTKLLKSEKIWNAVKGHMESYHSKQVKAHFFRILQIFEKGILFFMTDYWDEGVQSNQLHIRVFLATSRTDWWRRWRKYQQYRRIKGFGRKVCSLLTVFSFFSNK